MKRNAVVALAIAVVAVVAAAVAVPAVLGRHDHDPKPGITDWAVAPGGGARLVRADAPDGPPPHPVQLSSLTRPEQDFSFALLAELARPGQNVTVSPASLAIALSMLQLGARGRTADEIAATMRTAGLSSTAQAQAWHALAAAWSAAAKDGGLALETANSLWQQSGLRIPHAYLAELAAYFDTGVWQADFEHNLPNALTAIDRWTAEHTHGRITKLFEDGMLDASTRLVLANAVYFKADWAQPFSPDDTRAGTFVCSDGSHTDARFMHGEQNLRSISTAGYQAVELPYAGGRFSALAIMPTKGSMASLIASLSATTLSSLTSRLQPGQVDLAFPTFETSSVSNLDTALRQLGMRTAFGPQSDLTGIGPRLHVQQAIQRTYLKVAEKGTEAAAVTGIGVAAGAVPAHRTALSFDHPFLFLIRDTVSGAVLFASQIENPQA